MQMISFQQVIRETGISASTLRRLLNSGDFPDPYLINNRIKRWKYEEIKKWLDERPIVRVKDMK